MSLEKLLDALRDEAEQRRKEIRARGREEAREILSGARREEEARRSSHHARVEEKARERARERLARARRRSRRSTLEARATALEAIFREASRRIPEAVAGDRYREALPELLRAALEHLEEDGAVLRCSPGLGGAVESALSGEGGPAGSLAADLGARVTEIVEDESTPPGIRIEHAGSGIVVDGSLETVLRRLRPRLAIDVAARVEAGLDDREPAAGLRPEGPGSPAPGEGEPPSP